MDLEIREETAWAESGQSVLHAEVGARICADGDVNYEECGGAGKRGGERSGRETPKALSVLARVKEDDKERVKEDCRRVVLQPDAGPRDKVTRPIGDYGLS